LRRVPGVSHLDATERRIVDFLDGVRIEGATILAA
jgi:hypothetical protein